ncbi:MAG TPA: hypothetical protein VFN56_04780 [Candidatus Saccharimonadales bacterium]|nr:hypothetical protein [Candidatus Saccharimonadales bacterium]
MYGGKGGAIFGTATAVTGVAGVALLPDTGNSLLQTIISIAAITAGIIMVGSFVFTRIFAKLYR